jgi:hypothetical protein
VDGYHGLLELWYAKVLNLYLGWQFWLVKKKIFSSRNGLVK